jgi:hypothetical protein
MDTDALMRRPWLLYSLMGLNVVINALVPFMFLVSAGLLLLLSTRPQYRGVFRLYGLVLLGGAVLAIVGHVVADALTARPLH